MDYWVILGVFDQELHCSGGVVDKLLANELLIFHHFEVAFHKVDLLFLVHTVELDHFLFTVQLLRISEGDIIKKFINFPCFEVFFIRELNSCFFFFLVEDFSLVIHAFSIFIL